MNILLVSTNRKLTNGASRCVLYLAKEFKKRGINIVVAAQEGPLLKKLRQEGIKTEALYQFITLWKRPTKVQYNAAWKKGLAKAYYGQIYKKWIFKKARNAAIRHVNVRMQEIIKKHNIDLVHINAITSGFPAIVPERGGIPLVWHIREFLEEDLKSRFISKRFSYSLINKSKRVIAISEAVRDKYKHNIKLPIDVIYDGIDTEKFYRPREILIKPCISLAIVGRITEGKGQMIFVQAIKLLKDRGIAVNGSIYGAVDDIEYSKKIRTYIEKNNLHKEVEVKGFAGEMSEELKLYDILCVCSNNEGFGLTTVEGMAAGLLVCGAVGKFSATGELVKNMDTGLAFKYSDGAEGLVRAVEFAAKNREKCREIAKAGQEFAVKNFTVKESADKVVCVYKDVLRD